MENIKTKKAKKVQKTISAKAARIKRILFIICGIIAAAFIRSMSIHSFIVPNDFAPGGITGLSAIGEYLFGINAGYILFVLNIPLIIIAAIFINKKFALITGCSIGLSSALLVLWEKVGFPVLKAASSGDQILPALAGGLLGGLGIAIMFKVGGSSGGTDIIATLINRKFSGTNVAWFIFGLDATVVVGSIFVYQNGLVPVLLSFVSMFASSKAVETILQGFKSAVKFEVITNCPDEMSAEIIEKTHRGVTMTRAEGMFTHEHKAILICIVRKRQVSQFREILKHYPDSFAFFSSTSDVVGKGFSS